MSSVRKRTLPSGQNRWLVDYRDGSGARRTRQFKTKKEATDWRDRAGVEVQEGVHTPDSQSCTVKEAAERWLDDPDSNELEPSTCKQYEEHVRLHIGPFIGEVKLSRLSVAAVANFRNDLLKTRTKALTRKVMTSLKSILKHAMADGLVNRNVADQGRPIRKGKKAARHEPKLDKEEIPSKLEIRAMLSKSAELWPLTKVEVTRQGERHIVAVPWRPLLVTAIFTGLRLSEIRGLTWDNVSLADGLIHVRQRADFRGVMGSPKSEAGTRDVPLAPMAINTLKEWKLACPKTAANLVFPGSRTGEIPSTSNIHRQLWRPLLRALDLVKYGEDGKEKPRHTFHRLRHFAASLLIEQGLSPKKVQAIMGHSSIQVTYDIYGKLFATPGDDAEAMAQIEERLFR